MLCKRSLYFSLILASFATTFYGYGIHFNLHKKHAPDSLLVGLRESNPKALAEFLAELGGKIAYRFADKTTVLVQFEAKKYDTEGLYKIAKSLTIKPFISFVEANSLVHLDTSVPNGSGESPLVTHIPNDPYFKESYALHYEPAQGGNKDGSMNVVDAWEKSTGSSKVLVAIVDTGVDFTHPDLRSNIWFNAKETGPDENGQPKERNGIDDDQNGFVDDVIGYHFFNLTDGNNNPMDDIGHGTHVAGIIGALANNNWGSVGVNWHVSILPIKVLDRNSPGQLADLIRGIDYASLMGADIINLSWGTSANSKALYSAILACQNRGQLVVASSGTTGVNTDYHPQFPAAFSLPNLISVAATDAYGRLANFSGYGSSVHVAAPGVNILSTTLNQGFKKDSGTSMATAHVSGVAALVKSVFASWHANQIKDRLLGSADVLDNLREKVASSGRINARYAIADDNTPPSIPSKLHITNARIMDLDLAFMPSGDDGESGEAAVYYVKSFSTPINSELAWSLAKDLRLTKLEANNQVVFKLEGFQPNETGFLAARARDKVGNLSVISDSIPFRMRPLNRLYYFDGSSLAGFSYDAPWGLETSGNEQFFSDSPGAFYQDNIDVSLTSPTLSLNKAGAILTFKCRYDVETPPDSVSLSLSLDQGKTWKQAWKVNGSRRQWQLENVFFDQIFPKAVYPLEVKFRFTLKSDSMIHYDGIQIDDIDISIPEG